MLDELLKEISLSIRSRYPVIYLVSWEEIRCEKLIREIAKKLDKKVYVWTSSQGFDRTDQRVRDSDVPINALEYVASSPENAIFLMKDFHPFLEEHEVIRKVRDVVISIRRSFKTLIFLSPVLKIPEELEKDIIVYDVPLPTLPELTKLLKDLLRSVKDRPNVTIEADDELIERVVKATLGLTEMEAQSVFQKAIVRDRGFSEGDLPLIIGEKKQIIRKSGLLEYYDLSEDISHVGGLEELKKWLSNRAYAFSERAREYGLPQPKGLLLIGVQGCGKSLSAKAIASLWKLPLLRLDVGSIFNSFIGTSEENMRRAIKTAESLAPAILWLDEIDKGFAGTMGSGNVDAGTTARVFATFITWLQEKTSPVFVIATANRIEELPPELLRKGRFDEIFFIDLPSYTERKRIFEIHLERRGRNPKNFDIDALADASANFSGAEIEEAIISAMYATFPKNRDITTEDILQSIRETVPLSMTAKESMDFLREWARHRARQASSAPPAIAEESRCTERNIMKHENHA